MNWSIKSIAGKRANNEDSCGVFSINDGTLLLLVADGMGGHNAGEVASSLATDTVRTCFSSANSITNPDSFLLSAVCKANLSVYREAEKDSRFYGMGTTLVLGLVKDNTLYVANVGDSRLYIFHDNHLTQVTKDHAFVQELMDCGAITETEAKVHPMRHMITRCIGNRLTVEPDLFTVKLYDGDVVLLCSDGLCGVLEPDMITAITVSSGTDADTLAAALVREAYSAGSTDNITACVYIHEMEAQK